MSDPNPYSADQPERSAIEAKPWREAVGDARDDAVEITERSAKAVGSFSVKTFEGAKSGTEKLVESAAERLPWRRGGSAPSTSASTADAGDQPPENPAQ